MALVRRLPDVFLVALGRICQSSAILERCLDDVIGSLEGRATQTIARDESTKHWTFDARIKRVEAVCATLTLLPMKAELERLVVGLNTVREQRNDCVHGVTGYIDGTNTLNRIRVVKIGPGRTEVREHVVSAAEYHAFADNLRSRCNDWIKAISDHKLLIPHQPGEIGTLEWLP